MACGLGSDFGVLLFWGGLNKEIWFIWCQNHQYSNRIIFGINRRFEESFEV